MGWNLARKWGGIYKLQNNPRTGQPFKLGDAVSQGQVIIRLEDKEYENSVALDVKRLSLEIAEQEYRKQKELYEKGGVTLSEMRNAELKIMTSRYDVENAQLSMDKMSVKAPFAGVIVSLPHYTADARVEAGNLMVEVMDYAKMYLDINLPESAINEVGVNQPVAVTHYTLPDDTLRGVVSELSPAISMETRTFRGKIEIRNEGLKLRPGMFVKADIRVNRADSTLVIPKNVVQSQRDRKFVYIVEKNMAVRRDITTRLEDEDHIEITQGLQINDNLVVRGFETLRENSKVKVQR
ncbi:MAG: efflux RND transporter periplasmic adaptor subunit [Bacteroides sp.]|nr:efflux RND transporter periplasmic adaptor subunit [Bacteroides sp.]